MDKLRSLFRKRDALEILIEEGMFEFQPYLDAVNAELKAIEERIRYGL